MLRPADRHLVSLVLLFALVSSAGAFVPHAAGQAAEAGGTPARTAYAVIETNLPGAVLFADDELLGTVDDGAVRAVPAAARELRLVPPEDLSWSVAPVARPVALREGDTLAVDLRFAYHYAIGSVPYGAAVFVETDGARVALGETPLVHVQDRPMEGTIVVERPAYAPERFAPGDSVWNRVEALLTPVAPTPRAAHEVAWEPPSRRLRWLDYAALGAAAGAGVLAVHYKFKADRLYDEYVETTDPALRPRVHAYDTRSGVALGVMQGGLGVFALRLVLRH